MKNQKMLTLWGLWIAVALTALALTSATRSREVSMMYLMTEGSSWKEKEMWRTPGRRIHRIADLLPTHRRRVDLKFRFQPGLLHHVF